MPDTTLSFREDARNFNRIVGMDGATEVYEITFRHERIASGFGDNKTLITIFLPALVGTVPEIEAPSVFDAMALCNRHHQNGKWD